MYNYDYTRECLGASIHPKFGKAEINSYIKINTKVKINIQRDSIIASTPKFCSLFCKKMYKMPLFMLEYWDLMMITLFMLIIIIINLFLQ